MLLLMKLLMTKVNHIIVEQQIGKAIKWCDQKGTNCKDTKLCKLNSRF